MRTKFKRWAVDYLKESKNVLNLEEKDSFLDYLKKDNLYLEIGPGKGKFIIELSKSNKNKNYLVVELNKTIAGICAKNIDLEEIDNVKIIPEDFFKVVEFIDNNKINSIYLNFSDPWPKVRHTKRRLTSPSFLKEYFRILKNNGKIYFKTDNYDFYLYSLDSFINENFKVIKNEKNYNLEDGDFLTEFESKFKEENKPIYRIIVEKEDIWNY